MGMFEIELIDEGITFEVDSQGRVGNIQPESAAMDLFRIAQQGKHELSIQEFREDGHLAYCIVYTMKFKGTSA